MMLTRLYALVGKQNAHVMHRYLILMLIFYLVQGLCFAMVVPITQDLLQCDVNHAALWLMPLIVRTSLTWYLSYLSSLGSFEVAIAL